LHDFPDLPKEGSLKRDLPFSTVGLFHAAMAKPAEDNIKKAIKIIDLQRFISGFLPLIVFLKE
jgi:hypothetical protein